MKNSATLIRITEKIKGRAEETGEIHEMERLLIKYDLDDKIMLIVFCII